MAPYEGLKNFGRYGYGPEAVQDNARSAFDIAGLAMTGGLGAGLVDDALRTSGSHFSSRNASLYEPPNRPQRAFDKDYPDVTGRHDAEGRLTHTIDGDPIIPGARVVGRQVVGGEELGISHEDLFGLGEGALGARYRTVPPNDIAGDAGRVLRNRDPTLDHKFDVLIDETQPAATQQLAAAHETSHIIDQFAGMIPTRGLKAELDRVYSSLATGRDEKYIRSRPEDFGYSGGVVGRELMTEAIRAYLQNPNYLKDVAPDTAARIREYVNTNPRLNKIIQFNANAPAGAVVPLATEALKTRGSILPIGEYEDGSVGFAWPELLMAPYEGLKNFGRYGYGPEAVQDNARSAFDIAGLAMTGGLGAGLVDDALRTSGSHFSSRNASLYEPPNRPQRAFDKDYPDVTGRHDAEGRLTHDIEGQPIDPSARVAGRTVVGGGDEAIPETELDAISEAIFGSRISPVARREIGGDSGRFQVGAGPDGPEYRPYFANDLSDEQIPRVGAHEVAHGIDYFAGGRSGIPDAGIKRELADVYNTLNKPFRSRDGVEAATWGKPAQPQDFGYRGRDVKDEYMAEALRAYMANPNYMKTTAPKTAALLREYVNSNHRINKALHLNANAPAGAVVPLATEALQDDTGFEPALLEYLRLTGLY